MHAPHLLDVEVAHAMRRWVFQGGLTARRGREALEDFESLSIERYPHGPLIPRIWELRESVTAYDAAYLALAEVLDAPLVTRDARLARATGHAASIELV